MYSIKIQKTEKLLTISWWTSVENLTHILRKSTQPFKWKNKQTNATKQNKKKQKQITLQIFNVKKQHIRTH